MLEIWELRQRESRPRRHCDVLVCGSLRPRNTLYYNHYDHYSHFTPDWSAHAVLVNSFPLSSISNQFLPLLPPGLQCIAQG